MPSVGVACFFARVLAEFPEGRTRRVSEFCLGEFLSPTEREALWPPLFEALACIPLRYVKCF